jgi:hypothetical protein
MQARTMARLVMMLAVAGGLTGSSRAQAAGGHLVGLGGGCLTVIGDASGPSSLLSLEDCGTDDPKQSWIVPPAGTKQQIRGFAGKCLNASGGGTNDLLLFDCGTQGGGDNDRWTLSQGDSFEIFVDWGSPHSRCADASDAGHVVYAPCDGTAAQRWSFVAPPTPPATGVTTPSLPGFRFWAQINGERVATPVTTCTGETACLAGAIPSRAEVFIRIVGPKPNGYLWPNIVKFNTSVTEIWIEQISTGRIRYYLLPALAADSSTLPGLVDKTGFLP